MANSFSIADYPAVLTTLAYRPIPTCIARYVIQPEFVQDTRLRPGEVYQMDTYAMLPDQSDIDIETRTRSDNEILGTANTRAIPTRKTNILLREITGPGSGDPLNPGLAGNLRLSVPAIVRSQRNFFNMGISEPFLYPKFHESIGSDTLMLDYKNSMDKFPLRALGTTPNKYNPQGVADGGTYASGPPAITMDDEDEIVTQLLLNKAPVYEDGFYRNLSHPRFWQGLRRDTRFRELIQAASYYPVRLALQNAMSPLSPGYMPPANIIQASQASSTNSFVAQSYIDQFNDTYMQPINQPSLGGFMPYVGQALPGIDDQLMPGGYVVNQVRHFVTNNMPLKSVQLTYTAATQGEPTGSALRTAYTGLFFGRRCLAEVYGADPTTEIPVQMLANDNSDYKRFLILIWQAYYGLNRTNDDFVIEARSYAR